MAVLPRLEDVLNAPDQPSMLDTGAPTAPAEPRAPLVVDNAKAHTIFTGQFQDDNERRGAVSAYLHGIYGGAIPKDTPYEAMVLSHWGKLVEPQEAVNRLAEVTRAFEDKGPDEYDSFVSKPKEAQVQEAYNRAKKGHEEKSALAAGMFMGAGAAVQAVKPYPAMETMAPADLDKLVEEHTADLFTKSPKRVLAMAGEKLTDVEKRWSLIAAATNDPATAADVLLKMEPGSRVRALEYMRALNPGLDQGWLRSIGTTLASTAKLRQYDLRGMADQAFRDNRVESPAGLFDFLHNNFGIKGQLNGNDLFTPDGRYTSPESERLVLGALRTADPEMPLNQAMALAKQAPQVWAAERPRVLKSYLERQAVLAALPQAAKTGNVVVDTSVQAFGQTLPDLAAMSGLSVVGGVVNPYFGMTTMLGYSAGTVFRDMYDSLVFEQGMRPEEAGWLAASATAVNALGDMIQAPRAIPLKKEFYGYAMKTFPGFVRAQYLARVAKGEAVNYAVETGVELGQNMIPRAMKQIAYDFADAKGVDPEEFWKGTGEEAAETMAVMAWTLLPGAAFKVGLSQVAASGDPRIRMKPGDPAKIHAMEKETRGLDTIKPETQGIPPAILSAWESNEGNVGAQRAAVAQLDPDGRFKEEDIRSAVANLATARDDFIARAAAEEGPVTPVNPPPIESLTAPAPVEPAVMDDLLGRLAARWKSGVQVVVHADQAELAADPGMLKDVRDAAASGAAIKGFYYGEDGSVHFVRSNITGVGDLMAQWGHETGHKALDVAEAAQPGAKKTILDTVQALAGVDNVVSELDPFYLERAQEKVTKGEWTADQARESLVGEYLSKLAEKVERNEDLSIKEQALWDRIVDWSREYLGFATKEEIDQRVLADFVRGFMKSAELGESPVKPSGAVEFSASAPETGKPFSSGVVYHGTPDNIAEFDQRDTFFTDSRKVADAYTMHRGLWRSESKTPAVREARVALENPLVIDANGTRSDNIPVPWQEWKPKVYGNLPKNAVSMSKLVEYAKSKGHDGLVVKNVVDTADVSDRTKSTVYVSFDPAKQVKPSGSVEFSASAPLRGEWWIADGDPMFADGDVGEIGHEQYALSHLTNSILDQLGIDSDESIMLNEYEDRIAKKIEPADNEDAKDALIRWLKEDGYGDLASNAEEAVNLAWDGRGDLRDYAARSWGWKRIAGNTVETFSLTANDMDEIASGLGSIMDEEGLDSETDYEFDIFVAGNQKWYTGVPYSVIESKNPANLRDYDQNLGASRGNVQFSAARERDPQRTLTANLAYWLVKGYTVDAATARNAAQKLAWPIDQAGISKALLDAKAVAREVKLAGNMRADAKDLAKAVGVAEQRMHLREKFSDAYLKGFIDKYRQTADLDENTRIVAEQRGLTRDEQRRAGIVVEDLLSRFEGLPEAKPRTPPQTAENAGETGPAAPKEERPNPEDLVLRAQSAEFKQTVEQYLDQAEQAVRQVFGSNGGAVLTTAYRKTLKDALKKIVRGLNYGKVREDLNARITALDNATMLKGLRSASGDIIAAAYRQRVRDSKAVMRDEFKKLVGGIKKPKPLTREDKRTMAYRDSLWLYTAKKAMFGYTEEAFFKRVDELNALMARVQKQDSEDAADPSVPWEYAVELDALTRYYRLLDMPAGVVAEELAALRDVAEFARANQKLWIANVQEANKAQREAMLGLPNRSLMRERGVPGWIKGQFTATMLLTDRLKLLADYTEDPAKKQLLSEILSGNPDKGIEGLIPRIRNAAYDEYVGEYRAHVAFAQGMAKIFGINPAQVSKFLDPLMEPREGFRRFSKDGEALSLNQLLNLLGEIRQDDIGGENLRRHEENLAMQPGDTRRPVAEDVVRLALQEADIVAAISAIDPRYLKMLDWFVDFYARQLPAINAVHEPMTGSQVLPLHDRYLPSSREIPQTFDGMVLPVSIVPPIFTRRVFTTKALNENVGLIDSFMRHVDAVEHYKAWARTGLELRALFTDIEVQNGIKKAFGPVFFQQLHDHILHTLAGRALKTSANRGFDKLNAAFAVSRMAFNMRQYLTQPAGSIPAYAHVIDWTKVASYTFESLPMILGTRRAPMSAEVKKNVVALWKSDWIQARMQEGTGQVLNDVLREEGEDAFIRRLKRFAQKGYVFTKLGDIHSVLAVGQGYVRDTVKELVEHRNIPEDQAREQAIREFFSLTQETQIGTEMPYMAEWQRTEGFWGRMVGIFTGPVQVQLAKETYAVMKAAEGGKGLDAMLKVLKNKDARRALILNHVILPAAFNGMHLAMNAIRGDDLDEDDAAMFLATVLVGPLGSMFLLGSAISGMATGLTYAAGSMFSDDLAKKNPPDWAISGDTLPAAGYLADFTMLSYGLAMTAADPERAMRILDRTVARLMPAPYRELRAVMKNADKENKK